MVKNEKSVYVTLLTNKKKSGPLERRVQSTMKKEREKEEKERSV